MFIHMHVCMWMYAVCQAKGEGEEIEQLATTKILLLLKKNPQTKKTKHNNNETNQQY